MQYALHAYYKFICGIPTLLTFQKIKRQDFEKKYVPKLNKLVIILLYHRQRRGGTGTPTHARSGSKTGM